MIIMWRDRYQHDGSTLVPIEEDEDTMIDRAIARSRADRRPIIAYSLTPADASDDAGLQLEIGVHAAAGTGYLLFVDRWHGPLTVREAWLSLGDPTLTDHVAYTVDIDQTTEVPASAQIPLHEIHTAARLFTFHPSRPERKGWTAFPPPPVAEP